MGDEAELDHYVSIIGVNLARHDCAQTKRYNSHKLGGRGEIVSAQEFTRISAPVYLRWGQN